MTKSKYILVFILIILILAVYGYFKSTAEPEGQDQYPKTEITPRFFDFGQVEYGEVLEYTFKVKNTGNAVLEVKRVATSCSCTSASVSQNKIGPNQETDLIVKYDTGAMSGPHGHGKQERIIFIKTNDPINPQSEVTIHAFVK